MFRCAALLVVIIIAATGCQQPMGSQQQNPLIGNRLFTPGAQVDPSGALYADGQQGQQQFNDLARQVSDLNSRLSQFDSDNENLHTQVAALTQRLQNANNLNDQLKQQLSDTFVQVQQLQIENQQMQQKVARSNSSPSNSSPTPNSVDGTWQASAGNSSPPTQFAGATIRANNSLMDKLSEVQMPGVNAWMDGDVIRVEIQSDRLFNPNTYQVSNTHFGTLQKLATAIRQSFPNQVVGVEAHWDGSTIQPATVSHHELTATQALSVFNFLVQSGLPHDQVFTMAMGSNKPRYNATVQNGVSPNRRVEVVIYPESFR